MQVDEELLRKIYVRNMLDRELYVPLEVEEKPLNLMHQEGLVSKGIAGVEITAAGINHIRP